MIYITHQNEEEAKKVVDHLIKLKLVACSNMFPIKSCYFWKDNIANENEVVTIVKTIKENWNKVKEEVEKVHPYETPCIIKLDVEANDSYEDWIKKETKI